MHRCNHSYDFNVTLSLVTHHHNPGKGREKTGLGIVKMREPMATNPETILNTEKLAKLLIEKVRHPACSLCDVNDWELPSYAGVTGVSLPWGNGVDCFITGSPAVMLVCKCCGNIRLHSLDILREALEEVDVIEIGPRIEP